MTPVAQNGQQADSWKNWVRLAIAAMIVAVMTISFPAYRWFFIISIGVGVIVAAALYFWHRLRPIKESDIEHNKRPLGLD